ncbi:MAG: hypothetical protein D8M58_08260 [Calditrichaeota bacterium]|nr:MAG: hypothetical protein DWQ03_18230 [Calditrichota bacterium]MBL1205376.1 hypothetical protein [Calditrichota bacterium]NOG45205.1 hypothetical protein [Calditrichota bacterium]
MELFDFFKARKISETINATFTFIRQEFEAMGKSILFIVGPLMLVSAIVSDSFIGDQFSATPEFLLSADYWASIGILSFVQLAIYALLILVINNYILLYIKNDDSRYNVLTIFRMSAQGFGKLLGITIVFTIFIVIAFMVFFIPGVYFSVSLSLLYTVIIHEKITMGNAFIRSAYLIRDYWWFTFGLLILIWIIVYVLQMVFQAPILIMSFIYEFHDAGQNIAVNYGWWISVSSVISQLSYLFYGIFVVATTVHYYSQREKKEAAGLAQKIEALDDNPVME